MTKLFRGATAVRAAVVDYLSVWMPQIIDQARTDWVVDENRLPYPVAYDGYEPYALDKTPLVGVNVVQAGEFIRKDYDDAMSQRYLTKYTVRVFTWCKTPLDDAGNPDETEYVLTLQMRDDLAACMRAALVRSGSLGHPEAILFDETSLSEEYSEATGIKGDRFVAGVIHSFEMRFDETVPIVPLGTADTINIVGKLI